MLAPRALALSLLALVAAGCYRGSAHDADAAAVAADPSWIRVELPAVSQRGSNDCGTAALAAVLEYWGRPTSPDAIDRAIGRGGREQARIGDLERYARERGLSAFVFFGTVADLERELRAGRPVIVGVVEPIAPGRGLTHYVVVVGYEPRRRLVLTRDPARGLRQNGLDGFLAEWTPTGRVTLVAFVMREGNDGVTLAERGQAPSAPP